MVPAGNYVVMQPTAAKEELKTTEYVRVVPWRADSVRFFPRNNSTAAGAPCWTDGLTVAERRFPGEDQAADRVTARDRTY
jgi:hypothetical protein